MIDKQIKILQTAIAELGEIEYPLNSNKQKYGKWYGLNGVPWCAIFVSWVYHHAGYPLGKIESPLGIQYCPSALNYFKSKKALTNDPEPGDIVFFDWQLDGKYDHAGIYLQDNQDKLTFMAIEGNTAIGNDSNGGEVMIRQRRYKNAVFVHP
jgi:cell wall-associated NlpC family hydrolase